MYYFTIPDLLLYGLLNIHSLRQTKYFFIPQVKDIAHTCKQTPELTHLCLNTIVPKKMQHGGAKIHGILNENGKSKQGGHTQVKVKFPVFAIFPMFLSTKTPPHYSHPFLPFTTY